MGGVLFDQPITCRVIRISERACRITGYAIATEDPHSCSYRQAVWASAPLVGRTATSSLSLPRLRRPHTCASSTVALTRFNSGIITIFSFRCHCFTIETVITWESLNGQLCVRHAQIWSSSRRPVWLTKSRVNVVIDWVLETTYFAICADSYACQLACTSTYLPA